MAALYVYMEIRRVDDMVLDNAASEVSTRMKSALRFIPSAWECLCRNW